MKQFKQVILVRQDLKLSRGKMAAQVAHASTEAILRAHKDDVANWRHQGMKKSVLKVKDKKELLELKQKAEDAALTTALITDAGKTHIEPGTITCLAIGPEEEEKIDAVTGHLKLMG